MGGIGPEKIFFLLLLVLIMFGAKKIPEIGGSIAKGIREFKRNLNDVEHHITEPERTVRPAEQLKAGDRTPAAPVEESRPEPKRLI
jgi:sec-independent protein translocase protein TatA